MRVAVLNLACDLALREPEELLRSYRSLTGWADALHAAGAEVFVVQGFHRRAELQRQEVHYRFVAGSYSPSLRWWRIPMSALRVVRDIRPDVVHLNGLLYGPAARALRTLLPRSLPLVGQHHAERPFSGMRGRIQGLGLGALDGFFFTGSEMAEPWRAAGSIHEDQPVYEVLEGSSLFEMRDRGEARGATGLRGSPILFWAGNLKPNKDPLTILEGFELLLSDLPEARLYMAFREDELRAQVEERIASSPALSEAVELLGELSYEDLELRLNAADVFVQGSRYEGSGYALVDALACGVVPAVTDIPSFRFITGGKCGELWTPGDRVGFRDAVLRLMERPLQPQSEAARSRFESRLSFAAIGRQAVLAYRDLLERSRAGVRG